MQRSRGFAALNEYCANGNATLFARPSRIRADLKVLCIHYETGLLADDKSPKPTQKAKRWLVVIISRRTLGQLHITG